MADTGTDSIRRLTTEAEAGQGAAFHAELQNMSFDDITSTLVKVAALNAQDRKADSTLAPLYFNADYSTTKGDGVRMWDDFYRAAPGSNHSYGSKMFEAEYVISNIPGVQPIKSTRNLTANK